MKLGEYDQPRSSEYLERKALAFFVLLKQLDISKNDSNIICTSAKSNKFVEFGGCGSKNMPAMPLRSSKWFWREIHFECS